MESKLQKEGREDRILCECEAMYDVLRNKISLLSLLYGVNVSKEIFVKLVYYSWLYDIDFIGKNILSRLRYSLKCAKRNKQKELSVSYILLNFLNEIIDFKQRIKKYRADTVKTAIHEAGHFIVGIEANNYKKIFNCVSIIPQEDKTGSNIITGEITSRNTAAFIEEIACILGGKIATDMYCSQLIDGYEGDLEEATNLARYMIMGLSLRNYENSSLGQYNSYLTNGEICLNMLSNEQKNDLAKETDIILQKAKRKAKNILKMKKRQMDLLVEALLERGALTGQQAEDLYYGRITLKDLPPAEIDLIKTE